jgi:hypothetical protein
MAAGRRAPPASGSAAPAPHSLVGLAEGPKTLTLPISAIFGLPRFDGNARGMDEALGMQTRQRLRDAHRHTESRSRPSQRTEALSVSLHKSLVI